MRRTGRPPRPLRLSPRLRVLAPLPSPTLPSAACLPACLCAPSCSLSSTTHRAPAFAPSPAPCLYLFHPTHLAGRQQDCPLLRARTGQHTWGFHQAHQADASRHAADGCYRLAPSLSLFLRRIPRLPSHPPQTPTRQDSERFSSPHLSSPHFTSRNPVWLPLCLSVCLPPCVRGPGFSPLPGAAFS